VLLSSIHLILCTRWFWPLNLGLSKHISIAYHKLSDCPEIATTLCLRISSFCLGSSCLTA
jgi:hypothetical protein